MKGPYRDENSRQRQDQNKAQTDGGNKVKSVIFVPNTPGSNLAKNMREGEEIMEKKLGTE